MEEKQKRDLLDGRETKMPFSVNALKVVAKRYLIKDLDGRVLESPEEMFQRVANALAKVEESYGATAAQIDEYAKEFYNVMAAFEFTPAGRTLANAGGPTRLVSNCIVLHVPDHMEGIFQTLKEAALLQKAGSGLGFPLHLMRPAGTITKTSFGIASGPVSFLHVYNTAFGVIRQQARHGANMAVMSINHPDILEFIHCKDKEGDLRNFNVSVGLTDAFMTAVRDRNPEPWYCEFNGVKMLPRRIERDDAFAFQKCTEVRMTARQMFEEILDSAWKTGEPGCVFLDAVNKTNPLPGCGRIEACNPCGEQFLHDGDVCNLGSINLEKFVQSDGTVDYAHLRAVVRTSVRMLDNVIDLSDFPVQRVNQVFRDNRRVGLGVMGFADMLYQMNIAYNSAEGRRVAEQVMTFINTVGHEMSRDLAAQKGVFPNWDKSIYQAQNIRSRNAAITNVPPTGTISMMFDVSGGVEPYFALAYFYKNVLGGQHLSYVNKHLRKALESRGVFSYAMLERIVQKGSLQQITELPEDLRRTFVTSMDISAEDHILMQAAFQRGCDNAISKTVNFPNSATREDILVGYLSAWQHGCKGCTVYRDGSRQEQVLNLNDSKAANEMNKKAAAAVAAAAVSPEENTKAASGPADENVRKKRRVSAYAQSQPCPDCPGRLVMQEGCNMCKNCGYSKCGF